MGINKFSSFYNLNLRAFDSTGFIMRFCVMRTMKIFERNRLTLNSLEFR